MNLQLKHQILMFALFALITESDLIREPLNGQHQVGNFLISPFLVGLNSLDIFGQCQ